MNSKNRPALLVFACSLLALMSGCARFWAWIDNCADFPHGAIPRPNGAATDETFANQATKAEAEDFVVHEYEWCLGTADLDASGYAHLDHLSKRLPTAPFPVVIARSCDPALDQARRMAVIACLSGKLRLPSPESEEGVEIISPGSAGRPVPLPNAVALDVYEPLLALPLNEFTLAQRVVIGFPYAEGLQGQEAVRIAPGAVGAGGAGSGQSGQGRSGASGFSGPSTNVGNFNFR
jgi:hypothetical protein